MWDAPEIAFGIKPKDTKAKLRKLHQNIFVQTHGSSHMMWSHHQKLGLFASILVFSVNSILIVVIDDELAFVGGIDLCYGRYDDGEYLVTDLEGKFYPGRDYGNLCRDPGQPECNGPAADILIPRKEHPRLAWHDIQMSCDKEAAKGNF